MMMDCGMSINMFFLRPSIIVSIWALSCRVRTRTQCSAWLAGKASLPCAALAGAWSAARTICGGPPDAAFGFRRNAPASICSFRYSLRAVNAARCR